ncbi:MAG: glycosyltransferase family 4 protein, partial [Elusimicrobiota bacterium]
AAAEDLRREHAELRPVFESIHWVERPSGPGPASVHGLVLPEDARRFYSAAMAQTLREVVAREKPDLVQVEFDLMAAYGRDLPGVAKVLTQHDMGGVSFFGSYFREMSGWGKLARVPEWLRRVRFTRAVLGDYDRVVVMTEPDRRALLRLAPNAAARVVSTGVDLEFFRRRAPSRPGVRLVYLGHYPHYPNEDAALHMLRDILPRVRARAPQAEFLAVGSDPTEALLREAALAQGTTVTGTVPDVRSHLSDATVFVAPVRLGRGIKGKILEAFAMGVPVVASPLAAAGIDATAGRDLLVAGGPEDFAAAVVRLLESESLRRELGENGRLAATRGYDWRTLSRGLGEVYDELL